MIKKYAFPPLINKHSHILILGTLPGEDSLKFQQYYGHQRNAFWRIMGELIGASDLPDYTYTKKCKTLLRNGFALWDTLAAAERKGSLDSNIRDKVFNDIPQLLHDYPRIYTIGFNGKSARQFFKHHEANLPRTVRLVDLPSSSPAYTLGFEQKLSVWRTLIQ